MLISTLTYLALTIAQQPGPGNAFNMPQQVINQPVAQTQGTMVRTPSPTFNFNNNPYQAGYGGGYYPGGYYPGRAGGYLNGVANVTTANADALGTVQNARIVQQQANQAQLDTRRSIIQENRWEKSITPTPEDIREKEQRDALRRARHDPPSIEIWQGSAINDLTRSIQRNQMNGLRGPYVPLDPNLIRHLNVTSGTTYGGVGLFRDPNNIEYPLVLKTNDYAPERNLLNRLAPLAVQQAMSGRIADDTQNALDDVAAAFRTKVDAAVNDMSPTKWISASRFVNELKTTVKALQDPNASKQFNGAWTLRGNNVSQIVDQLTAQGLKFAPAAPGDEPYYTAFYNSLITYDMGLSQLVGQYGGR